MPPFQAGQYIALYLQIGNIRTSRPYSISSSPNQTGYWDVTVRRVADGLVSNYLLDEAPIGMNIESSGPQGVFHFNPLFHMPNMVAIAGGSGITPFMSMLREIVDRNLAREVTLFYGNQTTDDIIFHEELEQLSQRFRQIKYYPVIESPPEGYVGSRGYITSDLILGVCGDVWDKTFFLCGPKGLYDFCLPELESLGVNRNKVRREMYGTPVHIWEYPGWPAEIKGDDSFQVYRQWRTGLHGPGRTIPTGLIGKERDRAPIGLPFRRMQHVPDEGGIGQGISTGRCRGPQIGSPKWLCACLCFLSPDGYGHKIVKQFYVTRRCRSYIKINPYKIVYPDTCWGFKFK